MSAILTTVAKSGAPPALREKLIGTMLAPRASYRRISAGRVRGISYIVIVILRTSFVDNVNVVRFVEIKQTLT
jgi:hypothetical protein